MPKKNWIQSAVKRPGSLRKALKVPKGEDIPSSKLNKAAEGDYGRKIERKAELAKTLKKLRKK